MRQFQEKRIQNIGTVFLILKIYFSDEEKEIPRRVRRHIFGLPAH